MKITEMMFSFVQTIVTIPQLRASRANAQRL